MEPKGKEEQAQRGPEAETMTVHEPRTGEGRSAPTEHDEEGGEIGDRQTEMNDIMDGGRIPDSWMTGTISLMEKCEGTDESDRDSNTPTGSERGAETLRDLRHVPRDAGPTDDPPPPPLSAWTGINMMRFTWRVDERVAHEHQPRAAREVTALIPMPRGTRQGSDASPPTPTGWSNSNEDSAAIIEAMTRLDMGRRTVTDGGITVRVELSDEEEENLNPNMQYNNHSGTKGKDRAAGKLIGRKGAENAAGTAAKTGKQGPAAWNVIAVWKDGGVLKEGGDASVSDMEVEIVNPPPTVDTTGLKRWSPMKQEGQEGDDEDVPGAKHRTGGGVVIVRKKDRKTDISERKAATNERIANDKKDSKFNLYATLMAADRLVVGGKVREGAWFEERIKRICVTGGPKGGKTTICRFIQQ
eukprot:1489866-Rhodomonas_salina.1